MPAHPPLIPFRCMALPTAEERVLLVKLSARLQAASIAAGGLLLTSTQHDSCIAKLGVMQVRPGAGTAAGVRLSAAQLHRVDTRIWRAVLILM